jgi:hypothetical protein
MRHLLMAVTLLAPAAMCLAQTGPEQQSSDAARFRSNAVTVFGGLMSTTDFASTAIFNLSYTPDAYDRSYGKRAWDNYIAGVDYERDLAELARDLRLRAEVGVDDRFGHYLSCCFTPHYPSQFAERTIATESMNHSGELRVGGKLRWENFRLGGVRFEFASMVGLSAVTRSLGRERDRERQAHGNAHVLGTVAPETGVSLDSVPNFEVVVSVLHRSGAGGFFGGMKEAYNADVLGLRYRF